MTDNVLQAVRDYTATIDQMAPDFDDIVPSTLDGATGPQPISTVSVAVARSEPRSQLSATWAFAIAVAVVVLAIGAPLWFIAAQNRDAPILVPVDQVTTIPPRITTEATPDPTVATPPQTSSLGLEMPEGNVHGTGWPPSSQISLVRNNVEEVFGRTDASGDFNIPSAFELTAGDVITVEAGDVRQTEIWVEFTIDEFDGATGRSSGRADVPDGTSVFLRVYPSMSNAELWTDYETTVGNGRWDTAIRTDIQPDGAGVITLFGDHYIFQTASRYRHEHGF